MVQVLLPTFILSTNPIDMYLLLIAFLILGILAACSDNPAENPQGKPSKQTEETH